MRSGTLRLVKLIQALTEEGYTISFGTKHYEFTHQYFDPPKDKIGITISKDGVHYSVQLGKHHLDNAVAGIQGEWKLTDILKPLLVDAAMRKFKEDKVYINEAGALDR